VRVPFVGRIGPLAHTFDFVADAAPGVKEILGIGKLAYEVRERRYDLVVVDAEASGHVVAQVGAPRVIGDLIQVGMVRDQTRWMLDIIEDPVRTGVVVVTTPEEMPVVETIELLDRLAAETRVAPAAIVANRVLPALFDRRESEVVGDLRRAEQLLVDAAGPGVRDVVLAAQLTEARRLVGGRHLERLRDSVPNGLPILYVPELFTRAMGRRVVALVAAALADELDVSP
jgi:anion-transporting  ArsA/GET3 family ATPase